MLRILIAISLLLTLSLSSSIFAGTNDTPAPTDYKKWLTCVIELPGRVTETVCFTTDGKMRSQLTFEYTVKDAQAGEVELLVWYDSYLLEENPNSHARFSTRLFTRPNRDAPWQYIGDGLSLPTTETLDTEKLTPFFTKDSAFGRLFYQLYTSASGLPSLEIDDRVPGIRGIR